MPRKPKTNQPQTPNEIQGRDFFQTPNYAVDLLVPFIPNEVRTIWEPACGDGKIVKRLEYFGYDVVSTDIKWGTNFLTATSREDAIITNPPFSIKIKFFKRCMELGLPFALLVPADYAIWNIEACWKLGLEKIIPTRRIDYITPTGLSGASGHTSYYHSMWLTKGFNLGKTETFVELTKKMKENI